MTCHVIESPCSLGIGWLAVILGCNVMSTEAAKFFVEWLEANISRANAVTDVDVAALAAKCLSDAAARDITRDEIEAVAGDIVEAIQDEIEYLSVLQSMSPTQSR
jgi:hypothetical protein